MRTQKEQLTQFSFVYFIFIYFSFVGSMAQANTGIDFSKIGQIYNQSKSLGKFLQTSGAFSEEDTALIQELFPANQALPAINFQNAGSGRIFNQEFQAQIIDKEERRIQINESQFTVSEQQTVAGLAAQISSLLRAISKERVRVSQNSEWLHRLFFPVAQAESFKCMGTTEQLVYSLRSPHSSLFKTDIGYLAKLLISGIILGGLNSVTDSVAAVRGQCSQHIKTLKGLVKASGNLVRELTCGEDPAMTDVSISFWQMTPKKTQKREDEEEEAEDTHSIEYKLDYAQNIAKMIDDSYELPKSKRSAESATKSLLREVVYIFSWGFFDNRSLERVVEYRRAHKDGPVCSSYTKAENPISLNDYAKKIEADRKIFAYLGDHRICARCINEFKTEIEHPLDPLNESAGKMGKKK